MKNNRCVVLFNIMEREKIIVRTSIIGIVANVFLASFKAVIGLLTNSIAIVLDAVNNFSDALSSVITIIGTKLAGKRPDKRHPMGHGRVEYLTAMIISVIVLYAGVTSLVESVKKIINPETPDYTSWSLIIVAVAVVVKILLGRYVKSVGEKVNSGSLIASGSDAMMDAIISASTLVAALIYIYSGLSLEAWLGAVISLIIIKAGYEILRETLSQIIGERVDPDLAKNIKEIITAFDDVQGAYDLVLHSYGPDNLMGSVHIEIPDTYTADRIDALTRAIQEKVYKECKVVLSAVSIYSSNTKDAEAQEAKERISEVLATRPEVLQIHGFYMDPITKSINFDVVLTFECDRAKVYKEIVDEVSSMYPESEITIIVDSDFSD